MDSTIGHAVAGAAAGVAEHCLMFPVDTLKTRMQQSGSNFTSMKDVLRFSVKSEGPKRLFRGMAAMASGAAPAHAVHFVVFEKVRDSLGGGSGAASAGGMAATLLHDAVMTPLDVIKQRLQICNSPYRRMTHAASCIVRNEGWKAFYRSYPTTVLMSVPFTGLNYFVYDVACRAILTSLHGDKAMEGISSFDELEEANPAVHIIAGGLAGALAAAATTPLDVAKTRLQTQDIGHSPALSEIQSTYARPLKGKKRCGGSGKCSSSRHVADGVTRARSVASTLAAATRGMKVSPVTGHAEPMPNVHYSGLVQTISAIRAEGGNRALFRGIVPRMLFHAPAAAISWTTYEMIKRSLG